MTSDVYANPLSLFDLSGQSVVITGASGAMGRSVALALASMGAKLLLVSGSEEALGRVAAEARAYNGIIETLAARPDSLEDAERIIARGVEHFGRVDSVFVGSGYNKPAATTGRTSWTPTFAVRGCWPRPSECMLVNAEVRDAWCSFRR
jgi:NAD(P)-dependent dehydrogenase (short-subunit alcohol dehydrogenase family)